MYNSARILKIFVVGPLLVSTGCQAWHSSPALSGLLTSKSEREVVKQAKNDPFPSPSDVGMKMPAKK